MYPKCFYPRDTLYLVAPGCCLQLFHTTRAQYTVDHTSTNTVNIIKHWGAWKSNWLWSSDHVKDWRRKKITICVVFIFVLFSYVPNIKMFDIIVQKIAEPVIFELFTSVSSIKKLQSNFIFLGVGISTSNKYTDTKFDFMSNLKEVCDGN